MPSFGLRHLFLSLVLMERPKGRGFLVLAKPSWSPFHACREKTDDTSGEDNDEKETVTSKGRKTANSQGRRKGRITRSMANEANHEEAATPQQNSELGEQGLGTGRGWDTGRLAPTSSP